MEGRSRRRRERAQRLLERRGGAEDSPEEEELQAGNRHPPRRKKKNDALFEEDIIDGFAIVSFKSYEDIELMLKSSSDKGSKVAPTLNFKKDQPSAPAPPVPVAVPATTTPRPSNHRVKKTVVTIVKEEVKSEAACSSADTAGTSDEAPSTISIAVKREPPDSEDNRLSDASSRCSSGRGYICDSEGDDDKASDAGSVLFSASPPSVKKENVEPVDSKVGLVLNGHSNGNGAHADMVSPVLVSPKVERRTPSPQQPVPKPVPTAQPQQVPQPPTAAPQPPLPPSQSHISSHTPPTTNNHYPPPVANGNAERRSPRSGYPVSAGSISSNYPVTGSSNYLGSVPVSSSYPVPGPNYPGAVSSSYLPPPPAPYHPPLYAPYSATPYLPHPSPANMVMSRSNAAVTKPVTTLSAPVTSASSHPTPSSHPPSSHQTMSHQSSSHPSPHQSLSGHSSSVNHQPVGHPPSISHQPMVHPSSMSHQPHPSPISHQAPHPPVPHQPPHPSPISHQPPIGHQPSLSHQHPPHQPPMSHSVTPATNTTTSHRDTVATPLVNRTHSPRGHSPTRERESYSSNVSSLSRGSVSTPVSLPPYSTAPAPTSHSTHQHSSLPYSSKQTVWSSSAPSSGAVESSSGRNVQHSAPQVAVSHASSHPSAPHAPSSHPYSSSHITSSHNFPPAQSQAPAPAPAVSSASSQPPQSSQQPINPIPFSAESLFQSNQRDSDVLRRELDTRFLVSNQDRGPYLRTEMHHHQHQHTHVHQHTTPIIPPPPPLYASPLFKDMPKLGVDSPFYRQSLGLAGYPGYSPGLLHPTLGPSTPFAPPSHIPTFTPKQLTPEPSKPKAVKTGKWNAMHVRIAWEIYHHQQKGNSGDGKVGSISGSLGLGPGLLPKGEILRPPSHVFGPPHHYVPPHRPPAPFEHNPPAPFPPVGGSMFARYPSSPAFPSLAGYPGHGPVHDPWSRLQPRGLVPPSFGGGPWATLKTEEERERERNRERARREEKQRRAAAAAINQQSKSGRERSPVREHAVPKEEDHITRGPTDILGRSSVDFRGPQSSDLLSRTASSDILGRPPPADLLRAPHSDILSRSAASDILGRGAPTDILGRPAPPPDLLSRSAPAAAAAAAAAYLQQRHHPRHPSLPSHYPTTPHWDHPYRYDPLRFNPMMSAAALREEEEHRAKLYAAYPGSTATLRAKAPSPHRGAVPTHSYPPTKEEPSQSR